MKNLEFFKGLEDPIKKKETIDLLIDCYENSNKDDNERYSHSMYQKIVYTGIGNKVKNRINVEERFKFELYNFNKWKKSILDYDARNIKEEYRNGFIKLQKVLRNYYPKKIEDIFELLDNSSWDEQGHYSEKYKDVDYKKTLDAVRYNKLGEDSSWEHISTNYTNYGQNKLYDIHHRLYINTDSTFTHYFARLFMEKCDSRGLKYYYKIDQGGNRADTMVIYCSDKNLLVFLEILRELKREHKELEGHLHKPPFLTANIDNFIGYGSEPSVKDGEKLFSYNSLRTRVIDESMTKLNKQWIKKNKNNVVIMNGKQSKFIDYVTELVFKEQMEKFEKIAAWKYPENEVEFAKRHGFARKYLSDPKFIRIYRKYVRSQVEKLIDNIENYKQSDIDDLKGYEGKSIKLEKQSLEKALRKMLYITRANVPNFDDELRKEIYTRGEQFGLFHKNFSFDNAHVNSAIQADIQSSTTTGQATSTPKTSAPKASTPKTSRPKQYTYKPMTNAEILEARKHIGL